jgi:hypothetical protein
MGQTLSDHNIILKQTFDFLTENSLLPQQGQIYSHCPQLTLVNVRLHVSAATQFLHFQI